MAMSREQAREEHARSATHEQFSETIYGVVCSSCHNYILIDKTNCPTTCREHETCRQAYC
jgi:cytochrome c5